MPSALVASHQEFKQGYRQLRNQQDHARKQSLALKDQLKDHWRSGGLPPVAEETLLAEPEPPVDEDEDEAGYEVVDQPCQLTPPVSSKLERPSTHDKVSSPHTSSAKSLPPASDYNDGGSAQKRKFPSQTPSHGSSDRKSRKKKDYWRQDAESGRYFHGHSDGRVTWRDDSDSGY